MKILQGTQDLKQKKGHVVKGTSDPRQLRCPGCNNLAKNVPDGKGGSRLECGFCHRIFKSTALSA